MLSETGCDTVCGPKTNAMSQDNLIKIKNAKTGEILYTTKNKKKLAGVKIELKKFSKKLRKHVIFKEVKK